MKNLCTSLHWAPIVAPHLGNPGSASEDHTRMNEIKTGKNLNKQIKKTEK